MSYMRNSDNYNVTEAVVIFLSNLKTASSDKIVSALLDLDVDS